MADSIAGRALRGGLVLGVRQVLVHGANLLGIVVLARLLAPSEFGTVTIALYLQGVLASVCALGLGTSLVREGAAPSESDYRSVLAAQQLVAVVLAALGWSAAPWILTLYDRPATDLPLFRAVALSVLLMPLQTVPVARLERQLRFGRLAAIEVVQAVSYNLAAGLLAWHGAGTRAVAVAVLLRAALAALLSQLASPWRIGLVFAAARLRALARFGIPFQAVSWISLGKDSLTPIMIGLSAGTAAAGLTDWAQTIATYPTLALMILQRLYVPAFARVQDDPAALSRLVERAIQATNAIAAPIAVVTLVLIGPIIDLGFGNDWRAAQDLFYWLWCANLVVPTVTPLLGLLNALGRARAVLGMSLVWMIGTWALGGPLILLIGPIGFGIANFLVQLSSFWIVRLARERVRFAILPQVVPSWACAGAVGAATSAVARVWPPGSLVHLGCLASCALLAYGIALAALRPAEARQAWAALRGNA